MRSSLQHQEERPRKRRRSPTVSSVIFILSLAACSTSWQHHNHHHNHFQYQAEAFGVRNWRRTVSPLSDTTTTNNNKNRLGGRLLFLADKRTNANNNNSASQNDGGELNNGSVNGNSTKRTQSPLQVRRRVRAVLEKARTRTGIENSSIATANTRSTSSSNSSSPSSVVANAASIGGVDEEYRIEIKKEPTPKASTASTPVNGKAVPNSSSTTTTTPTSSVTLPQVFPDEKLTVQRSNGTEESAASTTAAPVRKPSDFDVIRGDIPAANAFIEPFPFTLPKLTKKQLDRLQAGERIQEQSRMGREGSGYVVLDVKAPPYVVWDCLLDFESYPDIIPTVRDMQLYTSEKLNIGYVNEKPVSPGTGRETRHYGIPSVTRASFVLSKFQLNIAAVHKYTPHPSGDYMVFTLDKSCTNMVLKGAKGIWHTAENPEGREVSLMRRKQF